MVRNEFTVISFYFFTLRSFVSLSFFDTSALEFTKMVALKSSPTIKETELLRHTSHSQQKVNDSLETLLKISSRRIPRTQFSTQNVWLVANGLTQPFNTTSNSSHSKSSRRTQSHTLSLRHQLATRSLHLKRSPLWFSERWRKLLKLIWAKR